jgi:hypothetical protein
MGQCACPGVIRCKVKSRSIDSQGREIAVAGTENSDGVESAGGRFEFEVFADQFTASVSLFSDIDLGRPELSYT